MDCRRAWEASDSGQSQNPLFCSGAGLCLFFSFLFSIFCAGVFCLCDCAPFANFYENLLIFFYALGNRVLNSFPDEDSNGAIDQEELKHCFQKLEIPFNEEEIHDLFLACDIDDNMGMKFNAFIVLLCPVYLLEEPTAHKQYPWSALYLSVKMFHPRLQNNNGGTIRKEEDWGKNGMVTFKKMSEVVLVKYFLVYKQKL
ncbi:hypothetical protein ZIOFF_062272 [Zingiber officinale]|uniref:EF-hand domain-containing protein n=1 Tax=Zingiber officinale TaxID=94328 RepID=A0A8J5KJ32_ZINOF|nr:hypothetical protein ZIOFF_062272 [Zingiber officinale]